MHDQQNVKFMEIYSATSELLHAADSGRDVKNVLTNFLQPFDIWPYVQMDRLGLLT
jgi:hypothetical protein